MNSVASFIGMQPWVLLVILLGLALLLLVLELFLPSHGILGAMAGLCVLGAVGMCFAMDRWLGLGAAALTVVLAPFAIKASLEIWQRSPVGRKITLNTTLANPQHEPVRVGDRARTVTDLRPMGEIEIGVVTVQATSGGPIVARGTVVEVVSYHDGIATVRAI